MHKKRTSAQLLIAQTNIEKQELTLTRGIEGIIVTKGYQGTIISIEQT